MRHGRGVLGAFFGQPLEQFAKRHGSDATVEKTVSATQRSSAWLRIKGERVSGLLLAAADEGEQRVEDLDAASDAPQHVMCQLGGVAVRQHLEAQLDELVEPGERGSRQRRQLPPHAVQLQRQPRQLPRQPLVHVQLLLQRVPVVNAHAQRVTERGQLLKPGARRRRQPLGADGSPCVLFLLHGAGYLAHERSALLHPRAAIAHQLQARALLQQAPQRAVLAGERHAAGTVREAGGAGHRALTGQ